MTLHKSPCERNRPNRKPVLMHIYIDNQKIEICFRFYLHFIKKITESDERWQYGKEHKSNFIIFHFLCLVDGYEWRGRSWKKGYWFVCTHSKKSPLLANDRNRKKVPREDFLSRKSFPFPNVSLTLQVLLHISVRLSKFTSYLEPVSGDNASSSLVHEIYMESRFP